MVRADKGGAEFLPQVILAGAPKCGTSSVFDHLAGHPQICASVVKETYYLMDQDYPLYREDASIHLHGWSGYAHFFSACSKSGGIRFEATPDYLYQQTPLRELPHWPKIPRIIFFLREPASRVYSLFRFAQHNVGVLDKHMTFPEFVNLIMHSSEHFNNRPILRNAIKHGHYVNYLEDWVNALGAERIRIYLFEDLVIDPLATMKAVAEFIGINPDYYNNYSFKVKNKSLQIKHQWLNGIKYYMLGSLGDGVTRRMLGRIYKGINELPLPKKTKGDYEALEKLKDIYLVSNQRLEHRFGINLNLWR